ncbi:hypothetical protein L596_002900 [Steinernema carpocapsae]|uniref:Uncharacterized protein n=1 Tax=Steinernema carpocapsae TaxID=34508 RepID=A0A4U8USG6_STECR|nr:hypothetical protein L596_002900 [Steinernema carpocapsae]
MSVHCTGHLPNGRGRVRHGRCLRKADIPARRACSATVMLCRRIDIYWNSSSKIMRIIRPVPFAQTLSACTRLFVLKETVLVAEGVLPPKPR